MNKFKIRVVAEYILDYEIVATDGDRAMQIALERARKAGHSEADSLNPNLRYRQDHRTVCPHDVFTDEYCGHCVMDSMGM